MAANAEQSYYRRYCAAAKRFELIGGVIVVGSILFDVLTKASLRGVSLLAAVIGAVLLLIGGSSLRPHNVIKSFAQQCEQQPTDEFAQGLLDALRAANKVKLVSSSIALVKNAVEVYAQFEESDPQLTEALREAVKTRISKKVF